MNNEQLRTQILTYRPTSPVAAPPAATYSLSPVTYSLNYSFSAKERDVETGLSYFGARYYSSDLSIWLSVDPMSDKYPSMSPYVYCADNPVKLVDPNGEDTIKVERRTGRTTIINKEGKDILRCGGNKVTLSGNGVFSKAKGNENQSNDNQTLLTGLTGSDAAKVYNFMADNTKVEWGYMRTTSGEYFVGAKHDGSGKNGESLIFNIVMDAKPNTVANYSHSHWSDNYSTHGWDPSNFGTAVDPNNSDHCAWKDILYNQNNATLGIRYSGHTRVWIRQGIPIPEFKESFYSID